MTSVRPGAVLAVIAAGATAGFAMGERVFGWAAGLRGHGVYVVGAGAGAGSPPPRS